MPSPRDSSEQLIDALIPPALPRQRPPPQPAVELPPPPPACDDEPTVMSIGRLDRSGYIPAAAALTALGWPPGMRLRADAAAGRIVLRPAASGRATVTGRAQLAVPVAVRRLAGVGDGTTVLVAALLARQVLIVHPVSTVERLLRRTHARILGGHRGG